MPVSLWPKLWPKQGASGRRHAATGHNLSIHDAKLWPESDR
ncbi:hypothetical protein L838_2023 [Mycobacterium avium MAV_120709_2344]|nr:hypothetical protein L838_2023 [Mycobacterium avium MAV_120709_2344]